MTPNEIEILIHFHVSSAKHPRADAPSVREAIRSFVKNGLIEPRENSVRRYQTTERGRAHIEQLCSTLLPTQKWMNWASEIIEVP